MPSWPATSDPAAAFSDLKAPVQQQAPRKGYSPEMLVLAEQLVQAVINPDAAGKSNGHRYSDDGKTKHAVLSEITERIAAKLALLRYKEREVFDLLLIQRMSVPEVSFVMFRDSSQETQEMTAGILGRIPELNMLSNRRGLSLEGLVEEIQRIDGEQEDLDEEHMLVPNYLAEPSDGDSFGEPQNTKLEQACHAAAELAASALHAMAADGFNLTEILSFKLDQLPHRVTELPSADGDSRTLNSQSVEALANYLDALRMLGVRDDGLDGTGRLFPVDVFAKYNPFCLEMPNQACQEAEGACISNDTNNLECIPPKTNRSQRSRETIKPQTNGKSHRRHHSLTTPPTSPAQPANNGSKANAALETSKSPTTEIPLGDSIPKDAPEEAVQIQAAAASKSLIDQQVERFLERHPRNCLSSRVHNSSYIQSTLGKLLNAVKTIRIMLNDTEGLDHTTVNIADMRSAGMALDYCLELISSVPRGPKPSSPGAYEHLNMEIPMLTCGRLRILESLADNSAKSSGTVSVETLLLKLLLAADQCLSALKSDSPPCSTRNKPTSGAPEAHGVGRWL